MRRARPVARWFVVLACALGCGAKTGLYVDDAGVDAIVDMGVDTAPPPPPPPVCIEVPSDGGPVTVEFGLPVTLAVVDVFFLLDATASMIDEIDTIRRRLRDTVVPGVLEAIPDANFGVALVGEFPVDPHGPRDVLPYDLRQPVTADVLQIESALERLPSWGNFDEPEAQVEGLFQLATGAGLPEFIRPSVGCPSGGSGGGCFRADALPVILLITDAPMNNGPPGVAPESRYEFDGPHSYAEAVAALDRLGALTIGLGARDAFAISPLSHLRAIARDTGAVDATGEPLAFDIGGGGGGVGIGIVDAISRLAAGTPLDVDGLVEDVPGDEFDARDLVTGVQPLRADPIDNIEGIDGDTFVGVLPGTRVTFNVTVDTSGVPERAETQRIPARVLFRAFRRSVLDRQPVEILIPGTNGGSCDD